MKVRLAKKSYRPQQISYTTYFFKNTITQRKLKILATSFLIARRSKVIKCWEMLECEFKNLLSHQHWKSNQLVVYSSLGFWKSGNYIWLFYILEQSFTKISVISSKILFRKGILILWHAKIGKTCIYNTIL